MKQDFQTQQKDGLAVYLKSPTILFTLILISVYLILSAVGGNFLDLVLPISLVLLLVQCNPCILAGEAPWTLLTSIFLHAGIVHLATNILFLLLFGWVLEEQTNKTRWTTAFLITGIAGNLTFLASYLLLGDTAGVLGVGASGAVYGIMGAATGPKVVILIIFIAGIDIFAGGGFFAHIGGLIAGLLLRKYWAHIDTFKGA